jgi:hypothetical protein
VYLCSKHRSWVFSGFVIFDNPALSNSQAPNGRLRENHSFRILVQYFRHGRASNAGYIHKKLQNPRATQLIGPDPTRRPTCAHTGPPRPQCPQPSAPNKESYNAIIWPTRILCMREVCINEIWRKFVKIANSPNEFLKHPTATEWGVQCRYVCPHDSTRTAFLHSSEGRYGTTHIWYAKSILIPDSSEMSKMSRKG